MKQQAETAKPDNEEAQAQTFEDGSEESAIHALMGKAEESTETPDDETEGEAETEADEADTDDAESEDKLEEVEYEGKKYELPPEISKALLRQADYSKKMNDLGAQAKDYTQRIETADKLIKGAETYAKALAQVSVLEDQIKQFDAVDFDALEVSDPARASILALKLMRLQNARDKAMDGSKAIDRELSEANAKAMGDKRDDMVKALSKDLPGWGDELGTKITAYAQKQGYTVQDIQSVTDAKWVIAMDKARRYDAMQESKAAVKAKAKDAPAVAKPGAKRAPSNTVADLTQRLRKTNSSQDAEALFLAKM